MSPDKTFTKTIQYNSSSSSPQSSHSNPEIFSKSPEGGIEFLTVARAVSEQFLLFRHPVQDTLSILLRGVETLVCSPSVSGKHIHPCTANEQNILSSSHFWNFFRGGGWQWFCSEFNADNGFVRSKPPSIHPASQQTLSQLSCCVVMVVWFPFCFTSPPSPQPGFPPQKLRYIIFMWDKCVARILTDNKKCHFCRPICHSAWRRRDDVGDARRRPGRNYFIAHIHNLLRWLARSAHRLTVWHILRTSTAEQQEAGRGELAGGTRSRFRITHVQGLTTGGE